MVAENSETKNRILSVAMDEFDAEGYRGASLRKIVKMAGVTTGAFYGYYDSKLDLFDELIGIHYRKITEYFQKTVDKFESLSQEKQLQSMEDISSKSLDWMLNYSYENIRALRILLTKSDGTPFYNFVDRLIEIEEISTERFILLIGRDDYEISESDKRFFHMVSTGLFNAFSELIIHDMSFEEAKRQMDLLRRFYTAGWIEILKDISDEI